MVLYVLIAGLLRNARDWQRTGLPVALAAPLLLVLIARASTLSSLDPGVRTLSM